MIDITLQGNSIFVVFCTDFINEMFRKQWNNHKDERKGTFVVNNSSLGYHGCLKLISYDSQLIIYSWTLPQQKDVDCQCVQYPRVEGYCNYCNNAKKFRRIDFDDLDYFLDTINDLFNYEFEGRYPKPLGLKGQNFDLCSQMMAGTGRIYPQLLAFIKNCKEDIFQSFKSYILTEMERIHEYVWGKHSSLMITFERYTFQFNVPGNGIWLQLDNYERTGLRTFSLHNVDSDIDFFCLLIGVIAMNTFFQNNQNKL